MSVQDLLELDDITLIPSPLNNGWRGCDRLNYLFSDNVSSFLPQSLPLFTSPMNSIVDDKNWKIWSNANINSVIPRTVPLNVRLQLSQYVFSALSFEEVKEQFLDQDKRFIQQQFKICLDVGNGHDTWIFELANNLKSTYGKQVILMGGNIDNPETYVNYSKSGFDFVRIGMTSGSIVQKEKFGFCYPMASLIMDTSQVKNKAKAHGIRPIHIIADGGIRGYSDIIKSIALGADYVMIGREFAKILEAAGTVYNRKKTSEGIEKMDEILRGTDLSEGELRDLGLTRLYAGNTTMEVQAERGGYSNPSELIKPKIVDSKSIWVPVTRRLDVWVDDFKEHIRYSFMMANSRNWEEFKSNIKFGKI